VVWFNEGIFSSNILTENLKGARDLSETRAPNEDQSGITFTVALWPDVPMTRL